MQKQLLVLLTAFVQFKFLTQSFLHYKHQDEDLHHVRDPSTGTVFYLLNACFIYYELFRCVLNTFAANSLINCNA